DSGSGMGIVRGGREGLKPREYAVLVSAGRQERTRRLKMIIKKFRDLARDVW
nr:hypothetical protein [Tanacetum cinerariifolium]